MLHLHFRLTKAVIQNITRKVHDTLKKNIYTYIKITKFYSLRNVRTQNIHFSL